MTKILKKAAGNAVSQREAVSRLRTFVAALVSARVKNQEGWRAWRQVAANERFMAECFGYVRESGMPAVTSLVKPFFHEELPLIGLNYTQVAHNTLHQFASGWTPVLRLCRGIVFSRRGQLVAFPFPKFFNYGEHADTVNLPDLPFTATVKHDGHLGIIFRYKGFLVATTRGSFVSSSSLIANAMLVPFKGRWADAGAMPEELTLLCEIIHPETQVHLDYGNRVEFILIGAFNRRTLEDYDYEALTALAQQLGIAVTARWSGNNLADLRALVADREFRNEEGFVARFAGGLRVKFKFAGYVGKMLEEKIKPSYIMLRLMEGSLEKRFDDLPGEVTLLAKQLAEELKQKASCTAGDVACGGEKAILKSRRERLYTLVAEAESTPYYRGICRKFISWYDKNVAVASPV